jgi:hypothetical protein
MTLTVILKDGTAVSYAGHSVAAIAVRLIEAIALGRSHEEFALPGPFTAGDVARVEVTP